MRLNLEDLVAANVLFLNRNRLGIVTQTLTGTTALSEKMGQILFLDPGGGAREVNLPAVANSKGLWFILVNTADAAEVITVEDAASAALTPAITLTQNEIALFFCNGVSWRGFVGVA